MNTMNRRISRYTLRAALLLPSALFFAHVALDRDARAAGGCLHPAAFAAAGGYRLRTAVDVPLRHRWLLLPK